MKLILLLALSMAAQAETAIEIGPSTSGGRNTGAGMIMLQERYGKWAVGLAVISEQDLNTCGRPDCRWKLQPQLLVGAERLFRYKRLTFGIGPYWFQNTSRTNSGHLNVRLAIEWRFSQYLAAKISHFSSAGSGPEVTICNEVTCVTNAFNIGQDAILLVGLFGSP